MKKLYSLLSLLFLILLFASSCKKEAVRYELILNFEGNVLGEYSWIVIHSSSNKNIIDYKKVSEGSVYKLLVNDYDRVDVTIMTLRTDIENKRSVYINTLQNIPTREWYIKGNFESSVSPGRVEVNLALTPSSNNFVRTSTRNQTFVNTTSESGLQVSFPLANLNNEGKLDLLALSWNESEESGFYGWLSDASFNNGSNNIYNLSVNSTLNKKTVTSSKPLDFFRVHSVKTSTYGAIILHFEEDFSSSLTSIPIYYAGLIAGYNYFTTGGIKISENKEAHRHYWGSEIPDTYDIFSSTIEATYNSVGKVIENIKYSGVGTHLSLFWQYGTSSANFYWEMAMPLSTKSQGVYNMPKEVLDDLSMNPSMFEPKSVCLFNTEDFNSLDGYYRNLYGSSGYSIFYSYYEEATYYFRE
ncbi:MAG: hypothetical protein ACEPOV_07845 [Hyphomicrobiales bacterium]